MELQPAGVPVTDPFLAVVRGRLPDVDAVVLAPETRAPGTPDPPGEPAGDDVTVALDGVRSVPVDAAATGALVVALVSDRLLVGRRRAHEPVRS